MVCTPTRAHTRARNNAPQRRHARRAGWERGGVNECVLEMRARDETLPGMRASTPVIIYHIEYDDGEKVPPNPIALASALTLTLTHSSTPCLGLSSTLYGSRATTISSGGRRPSHAPGADGSRGNARGGCRAVLPAVGEHAEKSRGLGASPRLKVQPDAGGDTRRRASSNASAVLPPQVGTSGAELLHLLAASHRPR